MGDVGMLLDPTIPTDEELGFGAAAFEFSLRYRAGILFSTVAVFLATIMLTLKVVKIRMGGSGRSPANIMSAVVICDSLLFIMMTIVHSLWQDDDFMCWFGFYSCAFLYASSKILVYLFMIEKQYVASSRSGTPRHKSTAYRLNFVLLTPFVALLVLMLVFGRGERIHNAFGVGCYIVLGPESALPLAFYDSFFTMGLTAQFARLTFQVAGRVSIRPGSTATPGESTNTKENKLRAVGMKNLKGSCLSLVSTMANLVSLAASPHGLPMPACYAFCTMDVLINCWVTFRMTSRGPLLSCSCPFGVSSNNVASSNNQQYAVKGSVLSQDGVRRNSLIRSQEGGNRGSVLSQTEGKRRSSVDSMDRRSSVDATDRRSSKSQENAAPHQ